MGQERPTDHEERVRRAERLAREALARRPNPAKLSSEDTADGDELGETPADGLAAIDLERVFDRASTLEGRLDRFDPEAGKMGLATRIHRAVRARMGSHGGRLVIALFLALGGASLVILALEFQTWALIVAASLGAPLTLILLYVRYQQWLGHKRYMYRLLESLGEDVSEFDPGKIYRPVKVRTRRR